MPLAVTPRTRPLRCLAAQRGADQEGFLLIEILIALVIIVVGVFAMLSVHRAQLEAGRSLARHEIALEAASSLIERFRAHGLPAGNAAGKAVALHLPSQVCLPECECRLWTSDYRPDTPGLKHVRVAVSWRGRSTQRRRVELETLMFHGGRDEK